MKKFLVVLAISGAFVACNNSSSTEAKTDSAAVKTDSSALKADSSKMAVDSTKLKADSTMKDTTKKM